MTRKRAKLKTTPTAPVATLAAPIVGARARATVDTESQAFGALLANALLQPLSSDETWSLDGLDARSLRRMSPTRMLQLLTDLSPEVSSALWNFLRMCNPGWTATAMRPSGKMASGGAHQKALDDFLALLNTRYGSIDVPIGRLFLSAFLRGALFAELVLSEDGRVPLDLATPDPASARWKEIADPELGRIFQLGQWQGGEFVPLDRETIRYVPIDPLPGHPEGRAPAAPALFAAVFLLAMLHDIRRVVQQQGYPRIDIAISLEKLRTMAPPQVSSDPEKWRAWVAEVFRQTTEAYRCLEPDDAYAHTDDITVNRPVGTVDASSLGGVGQIIEVLERMLTRALKTIPLLMATNQSRTETQANREWRVFVQTISSMQHLAEDLLGYLLTLALRAEGLPAVVQWRFASLHDATQQLLDAQAERAELDNIITKYEQGWISQDEASLMAVGHAPDAPAPRSGAGGSSVPIDAGNQGGQ